MANVKTGWLEDNTGEKFAPKTYPSQVIMRDGKTLEDSDIAYIDETDSDFIDDIEKDASDTILVPVEASGFTLNEATGRYEQTITVAGMTAVSGGIWDIVRSGSVLTEEEAEIVANITDVERLENGVKISCIEAPAQTYTLVLYGTFVNSGETLVSSMPAWFNRVEAVESKVGSADINGIGDGTVTGAIGELAYNRPYYKMTNGTTTEFQFELTSNKQYLLIAGYHGYGLHHNDDTTGVYLVGYQKGYYAPVVSLHSSTLSGVTIDKNTGILTVAFNKSGENYRATLVPLC